MAAIRTCPTQVELQQFLLGLLASNAAETIESHLPECPDCLAALETGTHRDEFISAVRESRGIDVPSPEVIERMIKQVQGAVSTMISARDTTSPGSNMVPTIEAELLKLLSAAESPDEIGRIADFRILRVLGVGGMGCVFEGEDIHLKRRVALKLMHSSVANKSGSTQRFLREAQAAAALKHKNVVTIYQVGTHRETPFIALELLQGESLERYLNRKGRLDTGEAIRIGNEIALGLAAAHERGLIHRDIKPANIWLEHGELTQSATSAVRSADGNIAAADGSIRHVKILDFGLAKSWQNDSGISKANDIIGTPAYMAPEQAGSQTVGPQSDLFSLGCVLYRMLSGQAPFERKDVISTLRALAVEEPPRLRQLNPQATQELSDLVDKLLSKSPAARPQSARAVADRLQAIERSFAAATTAEPPKTATPVSSVEPTRRKNTWRPAAAVAFLIAVAAGAAFIGAQIVRNASNKGQITAKADEQIDRRAAEWVKSIGGRVATEEAPFRLTSVYLYGCKLTDSGLEHLQGLQHLVELSLTNSPVTDANIAHLRDLTQLQKLDLGGTQVTDKGLAALANMTQLEYLNLDMNQVTSAGFAHLKNLTKLRHLRCYGAQIAGPGFSHIRGMKDLRHLRLDRTNLDNKSLESLRDLTKLQILELGGTEVTNAGIAQLENLTELESLGLTKTAVTDAGLAHLRRLTKLRSLALNETQLEGSSLSHLAALKQLEHLGLMSTSVNDTGLLHLQDLKELRSLGLSGTRITDDGLAHLQKLTQLRELYLGSTKVSDRGMDHLKTLEQLKVLWLYETQVGDAGLKHLSDLKLITGLHLAKTRVTGAGMTHLKALPNLDSLILNEAPHIDDTAVPQIARLRQLIAIELKDSRISAKGVAALRSALPKAEIQWSAAK